MHGDTYLVNEIYKIDNYHRLHCRLRDACIVHNNSFNFSVDVPLFNLQSCRPLCDSRTLDITPAFIKITAMHGTI